MATDQKDDIKITYATMSGDQLDRLHAALDQAIVDVKRDFGRTYPMLIDGKEVTSAKTFADESPIDTPGSSGSSSPADASTCSRRLPRRGRRYPAWSARPWQERVALSGRSRTASASTGGSCRRSWATRPARTGSNASATSKSRRI